MEATLDTTLADSVLKKLETENKAGVTSQQILETLASLDVKFSEATLRKYVQLGLLPRSVRVGQKGKHQGSKGMYPSTVVRQILRIKEMMAASYTIEEIQKDFLFVRGDIEELERVLDRIVRALQKAAKSRRGEIAERAISADLESVEHLSGELVTKLVVIEQRMTSKMLVSKQVAV